MKRPDSIPMLPLIPRLLSLGLLVLGFASVLGWLFHWLPPIAEPLWLMPPDMGLGFLLLGGALRCLCPRKPSARRRRWGQLLAGAALLVGVWVLGGFVTHAESLLASLGLVFSALGLLTLDCCTRSRLKPHELLAVATFTPGLVATLAHFLGAANLHQLLAAVNMDVTTALGLMAIGTGLLAARPGEGLLGMPWRKSPGGFVARRLLPPALLLPPVLGWARMWGERAHFYDSSFGLALVVMAMMSISSLLVLLGAYRLDRVEAERKATEEELRHAELKFRSVFQSAHEAIVICDAAGSIRFWNLGAAEIFGYEEHEVLGRDLTLLVPEPLQGAHGHGLACANEHGGLSHPGKLHEALGLRKDGSELPIELSLSSWSAGDGVYYSAMIRDISERREIERMKEDFLSTVSHELRGPLSLITGSLEMLTSGMLAPEKQARMIAIAMKNSDRLARLVQDILDVQRLQWSRLGMRMGPCELSALLRQAADVMLPMAEEGGVAIRVDSEHLVLMADEDRLVQALTNLLHNAIKFSPAGTSIRLGARREGDHVSIWVRDQGRGIPADMLERIFERFQQIEPEDARVLGGTGLGLAICRAIVSEHGGRVWAESEPGKGSTFHISLPLAPVEPPAVEQTVPRGSAAHES